MIVIALGSNMETDAGSPLTLINKSINLLTDNNITVLARSPIYRSAPFPPMDQPDFLNAVVTAGTDIPPDDLMALLHDIETELGRKRRIRWEQRPIDIDLIDYHKYVTITSDKYVSTAKNQCLSECPNFSRASKPLIQAGIPVEVAKPLPLTLPHPRAHERAFVLLPLRDIAPDWRHPCFDLGVEDLILNLPPGQHCTPLF